MALLVTRQMARLPGRSALVSGRQSASPAILGRAMANCLRGQAKWLSGSLLLVPARPAPRHWGSLERHAHELATVAGLPSFGFMPQYLGSTDFPGHLGRTWRRGRTRMRWADCGLTAQRTAAYSLSPAKPERRSSRHQTRPTFVSARTRQPGNTADRLASVSPSRRRLLGPPQFRPASRHLHYVGWHDSSPGYAVAWH
jgi:hypothetical protein